MAHHARNVAVTAILLLASTPAAAMPGAAAASGTPKVKAGTLSLVLKDGRKVSLFDERTAGTVVAKIGDEVVTLRDLGESIAAAHEERAGGGGAPDVSKSLARLIDVRLVVSEARAMGLDQLPEFKAELDKFTQAALRDLLKRRVARRARVDPSRIEAAFQQAVREWKITSLVFEKEADAKAFAEKVKAGGSFDALAARAAADKSAKAFEPGAYLPDAKLLPHVAQLVRSLAKGQVSAPTSIGQGYALLRVEGVRYPANPEVRERATAAVRSAAQEDAVARYTQRLVDQHARTDEKLLASIDYDGKDAVFDKLLNDPRVVARVDGKPALTVGDLTGALERKFFHGAKQAAEKNRVNKEKKRMVALILGSQVLLDEARREGLEKTEEFKYLLLEKRNALAFGKVIERVILPEVKVGDADVQAFYDRHGDEFTSAAMYRLQGLAFASEIGAVDAAKKLCAGTDLAWLRANAEGQLDPEKQALQLGDIPIDASTMPPAAAAAVGSARAGQCRTFAHEGQHYAVRVAEVIPPRRQPLDEVKGGIQKRVFGEKTEAAFSSWIGKVREHYRIEVLLASAP